MFNLSRIAKKARFAPEIGDTYDVTLPANTDSFRQYSVRITVIDKFVDRSAITHIVYNIFFSNEAHPFTRILSESALYEKYFYDKNNYRLAFINRRARSADQSLSVSAPSNA